MKKNRLFYQDDIPGFVYPVVLHLLQEGCEQREGENEQGGERLLHLEMENQGSSGISGKNGTWIQKVVFVQKVEIFVASTAAFLIIFLHLIIFSRYLCTDREFL